MASSWMLVLQKQEWLSVWGKVLICTSSGWWTADWKVQKEWWQKSSGFAEERWLAWKRTRYRPMSRSIREPDKRSDQKLGRKSSRSRNARRLGCVFQVMTSPKSILQKCTDMRKPVQRVKLTKAVARHTKIREKILRSVTFVQVCLMSVALTLQNLRIGLRRRQSGKSKVPAKQRGSWPKMCSN